MKKIVLGLGLALSLLSASDIVDKLEGVFPEVKKFQISDGTKFKIDSDEKAIITNGTIKCNAEQNAITLDYNPNRMCTRFESIDNYKFNVTLLLFTTDNKPKDLLLEEWTVRKTDKQIQLLRPNGFLVKLEK